MGGATAEGWDYPVRAVVCAWRVERHSEVAGTDREKVDGYLVGRTPERAQPRRCVFGLIQVQFSGRRYVSLGLQNWTFWDSHVIPMDY